MKFDHMRKSFSLLALDTLFGAEMTFFQLIEHFPKFKSILSGRNCSVLKNMQKNTAHSLGLILSVESCVPWVLDSGRIIGESVYTFLRETSLNRKVSINSCAYILIYWLNNFITFSVTFNEIWCLERTPKSWFVDDRTSLLPKSWRKHF